MKILIHCLLFGLILSLSAAASAADSNEWQIAIDDNGIQVFLRDVDGASIKEFQGTTTMNTTVDQLVALYLDPEQCKAWVPDCRTSQVETLSTDEFILYRRLNTPWPVKDREYALRINMTVDVESGEVTMAFEDIGDAVPDAGCCVRMNRYQGFWQFTPLDDDTVEVTFRNHFHPGGNFPSALVNSSLADWPKESLTNMKTLLESDR